MTDRITQELEHRWQLWRMLLATGGPTGVSPQRLRTLGMYGGAQGVWVDKVRTAPLTANGNGVTVGVLHTGTAYADDLSGDGVLYHYPRTQQPSSQHPILWWGVNSTLFGKYPLDQHPGPHGA